MCMDACTYTHTHACTYIQACISIYSTKSWPFCLANGSSQDMMWHLPFPSIHYIILMYIAQRARLSRYDVQLYNYVAYTADYRPPNVPRVELLTRKLYEHGTCTSWKSILYPSKWCLFQWAAIYSRWAVLYTIEVSFDQSSTTRTYYRLCIW